VPVTYLIHFLEYITTGKRYSIVLLFYLVSDNSSCIWDHFPKTTQVHRHIILNRLIQPFKPVLYMLDNLVFKLIIHVKLL